MWVVHYRSVTNPDPVTNPAHFPIKKKGPISFMEAKPSIDSVTISRAMATKEIRSAAHPSEKALLLITSFNVEKRETSKHKVCSKSSQRRAIKANQQGYRVGLSGNPHKLSIEDEDSIVQYITMLIKEGIPVYLDNVQNLVSYLLHLFLFLS